MNLDAALSRIGEANGHGIMDELGMIDGKLESRDGRENGGVGDENPKNAMVIELDPKVNKIAAFQVDTGGVKIGYQRGDYASQNDDDMLAIDTRKLDIVSVKFQLPLLT